MAFAYMTPIWAWNAQEMPPGYFLHPHVECGLWWPHLSNSVLKNLEIFTTEWPLLGGLNTHFCTVKLLNTYCPKKTWPQTFCLCSVPHCTSKQAIKIDLKNIYKLVLKSWITANSQLTKNHRFMVSVPSCLSFTTRHEWSSLHLDESNLLPHEGMGCTNPTHPPPSAKERLTAESNDSHI